MSVVPQKTRIAIGIRSSTVPTLRSTFRCVASISLVADGDDGQHQDSKHDVGDLVEKPAPPEQDAEEAAVIEASA